MQMPDRRRLLLYHTYTCIPFIAHYFMLGGVVAAAQCSVGALRTFLLAQDKFAPYSRLIIGFCVLIPTIVAIPYISSPLTWLTISCLYVSVYGELQNNIFVMRLCMTVAMALWLAFGVMLGSFASAALSAATLGSCLIGIYRYHIAPNMLYRTVQVNEPA
jgi:hypothetical protein